MKTSAACFVSVLLLGLVQANTGPSGYPSTGMSPPVAGMSPPPMGGGMMASPVPMGGGMAAPSPAMGGGMSSGMGNMNFNLSTLQGVQAFLNMEGINQSSLVTTNCVSNGSPCSAGGKACCGSPVFSCQGTPGMCKVVPEHANHIPQIRQIYQTAGVSTASPIQ